MDDRTAGSDLFLWHPPERSIAIFARAGFDAIAARLREVEVPFDARVQVTERVPPWPTLPSLEDEPLAVVRVRAPREARAHVQDALRRLPGTLEGWRVESLRPRIADGPGAATVLTLLRRTPRASPDAFAAAWRDGASARALAARPSAGITVHLLEAAIEPGSTGWDAALVEDFADARDAPGIGARGPRGLVSAILTAGALWSSSSVWSARAWMVHERAP